MIQGFYARLGKRLAFAWARRALQPHLRFLLSSMGRIAKSSGQVLPAHIVYAEAVLARLGCQGRDRTRAIEWFNEGKNEAVNFHQLASLCRAKPAPRLDQLVLDCMVTTFTIKSSPAANRSLHFLTSLLGYDASRLATRQIEISSEQAAITSARATLGVDDTADALAIRRAYRMLASRHHPDKLGPDASDRERERAVALSVEVRAAYDLLRQATEDPPSQ